MKIEQLISHLQAIAAKYPGIIVCVEDSMDPSDSLPITDIDHVKDHFNSDTLVVQLNSCGCATHRPFDINKF